MSGGAPIAQIVGFRWAKGVPVTEPQTQRFGTFIDITDLYGHQLRVVDMHGRTIPDRESSDA